MTVRTRDKQGHWLKGCPSPNPGGRPHLPITALELANAATPAAIRRAIELTNHEDPRVALQAIQLVLDRGLGRPKQAVDINDITERPAVVSPVPMTIEQWSLRFGPQTPVMGNAD